MRTKFVVQIQRKEIEKVSQRFDGVGDRAPVLRIAFLDLFHRSSAKFDKKKLDLSAYYGMFCTWTYFLFFFIFFFLQGLHNYSRINNDKRYFFFIRFAPL